MTPLRQRMREDMPVRNLSLHTPRAYLENVAKFARHVGRSPAVLGPEEIRAYRIYLTTEKQLAHQVGRRRAAGRGATRHIGGGVVHGRSGRGARGAARRHLGAPRGTRGQQPVIQHEVHVRSRHEPVVLLITYVPGLTLWLVHLFEARGML